jgi:hypothetical protein
MTPGIWASEHWCPPSRIPNIATKSYSSSFSKPIFILEEWDAKKDYPPLDSPVLIDNADSYRLPPGMLINEKVNKNGTA